MDLTEQLSALERAITRMGVRVREEPLPDEAHIDGGLCKVADEVYLYVSPHAPPWRRVEVLLDALRRLPHRDLWLPPEIRRLLAGEEVADEPASLLPCRDGNER